MVIKCDDKPDYYINKELDSCTCPEKYKNIYKSSQTSYYSKKYIAKESDKLYANLGKSIITLRTIERKYAQ
jgi:hypothetical protein